MRDHDHDQLSDERYFSPSRWSATLGKSVAVSTAKRAPVWANTDFSYRFSGLPPVEVYDESFFAS